MPRCPWAAAEPNITYHDQEWGVPVHDDRLLFEFLVLEGAQAGLSWTTILKKRDNYRKAFEGFRAEKIARYDARDVRRLLGDAGIVRNRLKIAATIENAKMFLIVRKEFGTFDVYLWSFVGGKPIQNRWRRMSDVPAHTAESDAMSRDLVRRAFKFVGTTICYALMQATGMVNDHLVTCPRHAELRDANRRRRSSQVKSSLAGASQTKHVERFHKRAVATGLWPVNECPGIRRSDWTAHPAVATGFRVKQDFGRRPPRLGRLFDTSPLYFVTFCTHLRKPYLARDEVHAAFVTYSECAQRDLNIAVGRYVIMPDHVHLFVRGSDAFRLGPWIGLLKQALAKAARLSRAKTRLWEEGFFDHVLRSDESYSQKWNYVRENPVRAGLVKSVEDWPYQGEIVYIDRA